MRVDSRTELVIATDIARRLGISPHTVVTHVKNAYRKLDVHTAATAVMRAVELGLLATPGVR